MRVRNVVDELFGEKIDITTWDDDPKVLISNVLSPAKVEKVLISEEENAATVVVPDYQLSLAIGKEGQNVRLAARLCGWKIDIKSHSQYEEIKDDLEFYGSSESDATGYTEDDIGYTAVYDEEFEEPEIIETADADEMIEVAEGQETETAEPEEADVEEPGYDETAEDGSVEV